MGNKISKNELRQEINEELDKISILSGDGEAKEKANKEELTTHKEDDAIHVSESDRDNWNGKQDQLNANQKYAVYSGTDEPDDSLGDDGDLYFQYEDDA